MTSLSEQIDALLALNAKGAVSHPVPGLAVELLERASAALSASTTPSGEVEGLEVVGWAQQWSKQPGSQYVFFEDDPSSTHGPAEPLVRLSEASTALASIEREVERLTEANEVLMQERTSLIETKRKQIARLEEERDGALAERDEALEAEDEAKDCFWAIYHDYIEYRGEGISTEAARTKLADRAVAAEARSKALEDTLTALLRRDKALTALSSEQEGRE